MCDSDGSNAVQLTSLGGDDRRGRDGPRTAGALPSGLVLEGTMTSIVISANGGAPRRLTTDPAPSTDGHPGRGMANRSTFDSIAADRSRSGRCLPPAERRSRSPGMEARLCHRNRPTGSSFTTRRADRYPSSAASGECRSEEAKRPGCSIPVHCDRPWAVGEQGIYFFAPTRREGPQRHLLL